MVSAGDQTWPAYNLDDAREVAGTLKHLGAVTVRTPSGLMIAFEMPPERLE
jgi:hypothetical protein